RVLVDMMGHERLGGNTLLFLADGLWASSEATDPPRKFSMSPFHNDFASSILASQDQVALESVCYDILKTEFGEDNAYATWPQMEGVDDYLHQAAESTYWAEGIQYDPENDGTLLTSLGVHEHWNGADNREYSRNLGIGEGIELSFVSFPTLINEHQDANQVQTFELQRNYPNPFNPSTVIQYHISKASHVRLIILDVSGKTVAQLVHEFQTPDTYQIEWDGTNHLGTRVPTGIYFARIDHQNTQMMDCIKLMLVK
ncbi:FlgD immunoglobulin-like domain containing protein, partial [bacterium]